MIVPSEQYNRRLNFILSGTVYPEDIRYLLTLRGVSQKEIRDEIGYASTSIITEIITGVRTNTYIRQVIAEKLGVEPRKLWGNYDSRRLDN